MKLQHDMDDEELVIGDEEDDLDAGLPNSLIITNLHVEIFNSEDERVAFECLFRAFDAEASFQYFKSFRRAKVTFSSSTIAAQARIQMHETVVGNNLIKCYFSQPMSLKENGNEPYLRLPAPVKQFLISPPASPPVGWEPVGEAEPVINYDLLSAIASLAPGEAHELHPPSETQPGIVVHVCDEMAGQELGARSIKPKIIHTGCPQRSET